VKINEKLVVGALNLTPLPDATNVAGTQVGALNLTPLLNKNYK